MPVSFSFEGWLQGRGFKSIFEHGADGFTLFV
jgi:hypothetical protein